MCQNSLPSGGARSLGAKISGGRGRPCANCTVLRAIVLTQYRRVTDGQTDGIATASTALAMLALRRAVKIVDWRNSQMLLCLIVILSCHWRSLIVRLRSLYSLSVESSDLVRVSGLRVASTTSRAIMRSKVNINLHKCRGCVCC